MAAIYYYTSTGNSLYAAASIGKNIDARVLPMHQTVCRDDIIGFVYPVYFWGLPRSVETFIKELNIANPEAYIFAVATYGGMTSGVNGMVSNLLKEKGLNLSYAKQLKCVENYIPYYKINDTEDLFKRVNQKLKTISSDITQKKIHRAGKYTFVNHLVHSFYPSVDSDNLLTVADSCIGCGICSKVCPISNINMVDSFPMFKNHCDHCLGCVHNCPQASIDWNKKTQGKDRYRHRDIPLQLLIQ